MAADLGITSYDGEDTTSFKCKSTHEALKNKLINYISTVYLGKNDALRSACLSELEETGLLYQEPYIEAKSILLGLIFRVRTITGHFISVRSSHVTGWGYHQ